MHPPKVKARALELIAQGINDCEISRRIGIPRGTIRDWRRPTYVPREGRETMSCPRCWEATKPVRFTPEDYAELLAIYLGDGSISQGARTQRLRIYLDSRYPRVNGDVQALLQRCFLANKVGFGAPGRSSWSGRDDTLTILSIYHRHLTCLFPQQGPGKKHERRIVLEPWQQEILEAAPWPFVRGCIRTDGSAFINRTGPYEYLSYDFSNMSKDIVDLFLAACEQVGVFTRVNQSRRGLWDVRINRRPSVALMVEHVGLKS